MARTIPSSWEMVSYTFLIEGVTRAFTHQFVRTRTGKYAQQTMRVLNVSGWEYGTGPSIPPGTYREEVYDRTMGQIAAGYDELVREGVPEEDARGVLPTNILTNIVAQFDMRSLVDMARKRASSRTQNEYRQVLDAMKEAATKVHPWLSIFLRRDKDTTIKELEESILLAPLGQAQRTKLIKLLDELRKD